jgi:2-C-methyl-D-erythritol 4-phosphate cytidylyltransferase
VKWAAVIVAAGRGARLGRPKQFLELAGLPMVGWSIRTFAGMPEIGALVIATEPESIDDMKALAGRLAEHIAVNVVRGSVTRQGSVRAALAAVPAECDAVLVHDGARPLVTPADVRAGMAEVRERRAALLATPVVDTIKSVDASRRVVSTLERSTLWSAQTPQFALTGELRDAHARAESEGVEVTDDAALLERAGIEVIVVPSTSDNFKVTLPEDIARAETLLCHPERKREAPESKDMRAASTLSERSESKGDARVSS